MQNGFSAISKATEKQRDKCEVTAQLAMTTATKFEDFMRWFNDNKKTYQNQSFQLKAIVMSSCLSSGFTFALGVVMWYLTKK